MKQRGFTLIEVVVVVAIVAILAAFAVPNFIESIERNEQSGQIRRMLADLQLARMQAVKHPTFGAGGGSGSGGGFGTPVRAKSSGVRILSPTSYIVFISDADDAVGGNEMTVNAVSFPQGVRLQIVSPTPPSEIRFRSNGTLVPGSPNVLRLVDPTTSKAYDIPLLATGQFEISPS
jgi:prepilin-type N-terminal cleavage/methylation domain-containing protein